MTLRTAVIVDVRPTDAGGKLDSKIVSWLRGIGLRQVRLVCGLTMFAYIFSHFFNHALGNYSYPLMETWLRFHVWWWRIPAVNFALYTAAAIHLSLGIWALYQRRHFRYTAIEVTQLLLGLSIPFLVASHLGVTWLGSVLFGRDPLNYATPLFAYWVNRPHMVAVQFVLMTVAWIHGCIGIYFWLRLKPFFKWAAPFLLAVAVLLPPLAMSGTHRGAFEVAQLMKSPPGWRAENFKPTPPAQRTVIDDITLFYFPIFYGGAIVLALMARSARSLFERRRGSITVSYPYRKVRVPRGLSLLETSLRFNIPHASVCGGRARCSTCRVRVVSDNATLPLPSGREAFVLARVGASGNSSIRLACQLKPHADVAVIPVLPADIGADFVRNRNRVNIGEERYVVSMFVDMRGSTKLAELRLPFDTVFLINRFLEAASQAVVDAGGQPNQFVGDGLLALFGLDTDRETACRQAIRASALVASNVDRMNREFASELPEPIKFGIGIHAGEVIIGDIGFRDHAVFTAVGDAVNVAARLQDMTKALNCVVVVSEEVCESAGIRSDALSRKEVEIRGRDNSMIVYAVADAVLLGRLLDEQARSENSEAAATAFRVSEPEQSVRS
ncbi:MAG: adenylate/guanylate cyclase domain-containing protein [Afipia sp.]|nr:adenylate/guanylate cyclase domain-containing protein [Afipia sp.]